MLHIHDKSWCALAASILGFALFGTACGDGVDGPDDPQNPAGLGPAAVDLGSTTDPAAAGDYVILAKTGITNVTGSVITGGDLLDR